MKRSAPRAAASALIAFLALALAACEFASRILGVAASRRGDGSHAGEELIVTSPNGGERWKAGSSYSVTWSGAERSAAVTVDLLENGLLRQPIIEGAANTGSYSWTVPADLQDSGRYAVRVRSDEEDLTDESDGTFAIACRPWLSLVEPSGHEPLSIGGPCTIAWECVAAGEFVRIELMRDGRLEGTISASTPNDGSHEWTVDCEEPSPPEGDPRGRRYTVRVSSVSLPYLADASDRPFEIRKTQGWRKLRP